MRTFVAKISRVVSGYGIFFQQSPLVFIRHRDCYSLNMFQPPVPLSQESDSYVGKSVTAPAQTFFVDDKAPNVLVSAIRRRWDRALLRRRVGRAYDMALEIAHVIPPDSRVLDVGCGRGFIAQHLSAMVGSRVIGIDVGATAAAAIDYRQFDGQHFPLADDSVDAVLFSYVLHHAQNLNVVMNEVRRVLTRGGLVVIYEDIPASWWDRIFCGFHDLKWRKRTGPCTFHSESGWKNVFNSAGLEIIRERALSRWRDLTHPVLRKFYVLRVTGGDSAHL
jgi:SAM-dependent methyltransferase